MVPSFQFHKGTIETDAPQGTLLYSPDFNSIKVRLKPSSAMVAYTTLLFQFHKGTIETLTRRAVITLSDISIP